MTLHAKKTLLAHLTDRAKLTTCAKVLLCPFNTHLEYFYTASCILKMFFSQRAGIGNIFFQAGAFRISVLMDSVSRSRRIMRF